MCTLQSERQVNRLYKAQELWTHVSALSTVSFPWQAVFMRERESSNSSSWQLQCKTAFLSSSGSPSVSHSLSKRRWPQTPKQTECIQGGSVQRDKWRFIMAMYCKCPCAATVFRWEASEESTGPERFMSSRREVWQGIKITINFTTCDPLKWDAK